MTFSETIEARVKVSVAALQAQFATTMSSMRAMTVGEAIMASLVILFVLIGGVGQLLALNFWTDDFPNSDNGLFTVLTLSSIMNAVVFTVILGIWILIKRPPIAFLLEPFGILVVSLAGLSISLNGVLIVAATFNQNAPEIFQALLLSTMLPWTFLFVKVIFAETRSYLSPLVIGSFLCSFAGIVLGAAQGFAGESFTFDAWMWTLIFAIGVIPGAMNSVLSAKYMRRFTDTTAAEEARAKKRARFPDGEHTTLLLGPAETVIDRPVTDPTTAKLAMLALSGIAQVFGMLVFVPASAIPWFSTEPSVGAAYRDIAAGVACSFGAGGGECTTNLHFMLAFNVCFLIGGAAQAFLNFYSPALTSIVTQLQSPMATMVLMIAPALAPPGSPPPAVGFTIGAVIFLVLGAIVYSIWEEGTRRQRHEEVGTPILEENISGIVVSK